MDTHGIRRDRGRVEMEVGGQWSSLCMYPNTAPVVCRQLGFPYAAMLTNASTPASSLFGHRELLANEVAFYCLGYEANLFDCEQEVWYGYCTTNYIITCSGYRPVIRITRSDNQGQLLSTFPEVIKGHNVTFVCDADSNPPPASITWSGKVSSTTGELHIIAAQQTTHEGS